MPNHGTGRELFAEYLYGVADDLVGIVKQVVKAILREDAALEVGRVLSNSHSTRVTLSKRFSIREILSILACLSIFYLLFQFQIKGFIKEFQESNLRILCGKEKARMVC